MEQKTKVVLTYNGDVADMLLLSDEQLRLLQFLYNEEYLIDDTNYRIMGKEEQFHEV